MPRYTGSRPRPPIYILEPAALVYQSVRQALGIKPVSPEALDTYRVILGFAWMNKYQFTPPITRRMIADERGIADESTITRHVAELVDAGYMTVNPNSGSASTYIPHITHQTNTATAHNSPAVSTADTQPTAYSPAGFPADTQPINSETQPPQHETEGAAQPLACVQGVPAQPLARAPGVPINSSSSLIHLNQNLDPQLLLLYNLLLDFGVFPDSAGEIIRAEPPHIILAWLHAIVEDDNIRNIASVIVANILRDRRLPPRQPDPGTSLARQRIAREVQWGIRPATVAAPVPVERPAPDVPMSTEMQTIWRQALDELKLQLTTGTFQTFLEHAQLVSAQDGVYVIDARNEHAREWLDARLRTTVERALAGVTGRPASATFIVEEQHAIA